MIVLAIGGNEQTSREAWSLKHMGDRASLDLVGRQDELVKAMLATGKPVVALLFNGRPLSINYSRRMCRRFWSAGIWARNAATRSRMFCSATSIPAANCRSRFRVPSGHLPVFYNHKPSARRGYLWDDVYAAVSVWFWPELHDVCVQERAARQKKIGATVRRACWSTSQTPASAPGTEVVQMYIRDLVSSVTRPVKELKVSGKFSLKPGETKTVVAGNHAGIAGVLRHQHEATSSSRASLRSWSALPRATRICKRSILTVREMTFEA